MGNGYHDPREPWQIDKQAPATEATRAVSVMLLMFLYGVGETGQVNPLHAWAGPSSSSSSSPE